MLYGEHRRHKGVEIKGYKGAGELRITANGWIRGETVGVMKEHGWSTPRARTGARSGRSPRPMRKH